MLIWTCTFIYFLKSVEPVRLYGPVQLFETQEYCSKNSYKNFTTFMLTQTKEKQPLGTRAIFGRLNLLCFGKIVLGVA